MKTRLLFVVPLFILVYFFVHNTVDFFYFLNPVQVLKTVLVYAIITGLFYLGGFFFFRNKTKYTLQFSSVLFLFLFFGSFMDMSDKYFPLDRSGGYYSKLCMIFLGGCFAIILITAWLNKATVQRFLKFWIIYSLVLCIYDSATVVISPKKEKKYLSAPKELKINPASSRPSVFFFLFDMYPSDTVFKKYLNYDNSELSAFLKEKDFFVTSNSHSLYDATYYSLCSTLNLAPLNFYTDNSLPEYQKRLIALEQSEHTTLLNAFENAGYTIRNFSVFDLQDKPSPLTFNLHYHIGNVLTSTTFYNRLYNNIEPDFILAHKNIDISFLKESWSSKAKKDIIKLDKNFNNVLDSFSITKKPSFNYFHFMIPHPPALYDSNGHENMIKDMYAFNGLEKSLVTFTSYTRYGNKKIEEMVNRIFEKAGKNVIIIIQGDHGYREFSERLLKEVRYGILNSVYLPSKNYAGFNDSITPVNTFRQILFNQFNTTFR